MVEYHKSLIEEKRILPLLRQSLKAKNSTIRPFSTSWSSPSNIALVKYWGKFGVQLPMNPSISFSLSRSVTIMSLQANPKEDSGNVSVSFRFEEQKNELFGSKISKYLESILPYCPYITSFDFDISSGNTFPHSAGIASSASSMSALALCLTDFERHLFGLWTSYDQFLARASWLARLASGSASRSIYGGFAVWGKTNAIPAASNYFAVPAGISIHPAFINLGDAILIVKSAPKKISSRQGHQLMINHPFRAARIKQARNNLTGLLNAVSAGNWKDFATIVENEALTLHALMMSSESSFTLLEPNTLYFVEQIKKIREQNNLDLCFTLDAGPNLHVIYNRNQKEQVMEKLKPLLNLCEESKWIDDKIGEGPLKL